MDLKGKVVLISGATGGIGSALVHGLASEGCKLALCARREDQLKALSEEMMSKNVECTYHICDAKQSNEIVKTVAAVQKHYGRIDIAFLTAGILIPTPIVTFDSSIIKESMEINFLGTVFFIEQLLSVMKTQNDGTIATVSTLPDRRGVAGWGAYGASKAALSWLLESLRAEAKQKYNINIVTIKPGSVQTPMIEGFHRQGAVSPEKAVDYIISGIKKNKKVIQFPLAQVVMVRLKDLFPVFAYDRVPIDLQKGDGYPKSKEK